MFAVEGEICMNRISIITLGVKDIKRSLKFYRDGLGIQTSVSGDNPGIVFLILPAPGWHCILSRVWLKISMTKNLR